MADTIQSRAHATVVGALADARVRPDTIAQQRPCDKFLFEIIPALVGYLGLLAFVVLF